MHNCSLQWVTPNAEQQIIDIARVSTNKPKGEPGEKLLAYLIEHKHWSPFEMVDMCLEVKTTRDISHQMVRHRSFFFQEFSQRYSEVDSAFSFTNARYQHPTNKQLSIETTEDSYLGLTWNSIQANVCKHAVDGYLDARHYGVAKEVARKILPEGMTPTRLFMKGNCRNWIHYIEARTYEGAQLEHRLVAQSAKKIFIGQFPTLAKVLYKDGDVESK